MRFGAGGDSMITKIDNMQDLLDEIVGTAQDCMKDLDDLKKELTEAQKALDSERSGKPLDTSRDSDSDKRS